jgi:hypothetical protein
VVVQDDGRKVELETPKLNIDTERIEKEEKKERKLERDIE